MGTKTPGVDIRERDYLIKEHRNLVKNIVNHRYAGTRAIKAHTREGWIQDLEGELPDIVTEWLEQSEPRKVPINVHIYNYVTWAMWKLAGNFFRYSGHLVPLEDSHVKETEGTFEINTEFDEGISIHARKESRRHVLKHYPNETDESVIEEKIEERLRKNWTFRSWVLAESLTPKPDSMTPAMTDAVGQTQIISYSCCKTGEYGKLKPNEFSPEPHVYHELERLEREISRARVQGNEQRAELEQKAQIARLTAKGARVNDRLPAFVPQNEAELLKIATVWWGGRLAELARLNPKQRKVAILYFGIEGIAQEEVARIMGCSQKVVSGYLSRIEKNIKNLPR